MAGRTIVAVLGLAIAAVNGCEDETADNYNPGSGWACAYPPVLGCLEPGAVTQTAGKQHGTSHCAALGGQACSSHSPAISPTRTPREAAQSPPPHPPPSLRAWWLAWAGEHNGSLSRQSLRLVCPPTWHTDQ